MQVPLPTERVLEYLHEKLKYEGPISSLLRDLVAFNPELLASITPAIRENCRALSEKRKPGRVAAPKIDKETTPMVFSIGPADTVSQFEGRGSFE